MQNRTYFVAAAAVAAAVIFFGASRTPAAEQFSTTAQSSTPGRIIRVSGTAVVYGKPDYATIEIGVTKLSTRVMDAKAGCDAAMLRVEESLRKAGVQDADIQTVNYQIYQVQPEGKPVQPKQWKVAHRISVRVRRVASVANVLEAATGSGATDISQVQYSLEKVLALRSQARAEAVRVAREKAEELARLNHVQIGDPITISDSSYEGFSGYAQSANVAFDMGSMAREPSSVMSGGQIAVNAREDIEFAIR